MKNILSKIGNNHLQCVGPTPKNMKHIRCLDGGKFCMSGPFNKHKIWITIKNKKIYIDLINFKEVTREEYFKLKRPKNLNNNGSDSTTKFRFGNIKNEYKIMYTTLNNSIRIMTKIELFKDKKLIYETALVNKNIRNQNYVLDYLSKLFMNTEKDIEKVIQNKIKKSKKLVEYPYYYVGIF